MRSSLSHPSVALMIFAKSELDSSADVWRSKWQMRPYRESASGKGMYTRLPKRRSTAESSSCIAALGSRCLMGERGGRGYLWPVGGGQHKHKRCIIPAIRTNQTIHLHKELCFQAPVVRAVMAAAAP